MKPATFAALLKGDIENAIIAETPGGIEAQEAQGQQQFAMSESLPIECIGCTREQLEKIGIIFGDPVDDLFVAVKLPDGWRKATTDHPLWTDLIDDKGCKRAMMFYKAAFYDRHAHISLTNRYSSGVDYDFIEDNCRTKRRCVVKDIDNIIYQTKEIEWNDDRPDWEVERALEKEANDWLDDHYPDHDNPLAYWD